MDELQRHAAGGLADEAAAGQRCPVAQLRRNAAAAAAALCCGCCAVLRCLRVRARLRQGREDEAWVEAVRRANERDGSAAGGTGAPHSSFIVLGSASALAGHFMAAAADAGRRCCGVSRRRPDGVRTHAACDLSDSAAAVAVARQLSGEWRGSAAVLFATTYTQAGDEALVRAAVSFAEAAGCTSFVFISSWVAGFEPAALDFGYRAAKRAAEREVAECSSKFPGGVDIVRVSNVIGAPDLVQQRLLDRFGSLLPSTCTRAYIDVAKVCEELIRFRPAAGARVHSLYGRRLAVGPLSRPPLVVLRPLCLFARICNRALLAGLRQVHTYFQGWTWSLASPCCEEELLSFARGCNGDVVWLGGCATVDFFRFDNGDAVVVSTRKMNRVTAMPGAGGTVWAEAGATYGDVLRVVGGEGRTLGLVPNYTFVTVGASLAAPLHGMSPGTPTVSTMVDGVRVFDLEAGSVRTVDSHAEAATLLFRRGEMVYLGASLRTRPDRGWRERRRYVPAPRFNGDSVYTLMQDTLAEVGDDLVEIRCMCPAVGYRWLVYRYTLLTDGAPRGPPRNLMGQMWDWAPVRWLLRHGSGWLTNSEVFVDVGHFADFMTDFHACCLRFTSWRMLPGVVKLNVRLMRQEDCARAVTARGDVVAVDFGFCTLNPAAVRVIGELLERHRGSVRLHPAKFVDPSWQHLVC
eukprot:TRINITY_DN1200_c0_g2_i2.p1 TRINITY_DN1200_c0_g2~~TRINITY_DN1200_c0_g2_i2.p1  ORF type:complete len:689 (+),score=198.42 TRINITY_DN1200_c0_g2_i2:760-2826(+)